MFDIIIKCTVEMQGSDYSKYQRFHLSDENK